MSLSPTELDAVHVADAEVSSYSEHRPLAFRVAHALALYAPRGQGWFPRAIGRGGGRNLRVAIRTQNGAKLAVLPVALDYFVHILKSGGIIEAHVRDACLWVLRPGDVFYDIGANVGMMANDIAAAMQGRLHVVAFEPMPDAAHATALSARLNGFEHFEVFQVMLGPAAGTTRLFVPGVIAHASAVPRKEGTPSIECPVLTLDSLVESGRIPPPDVIKIDVEGGERGVFRGSHHTIGRHAPFIVFEADINMRRFGYSRAELLADLSALAPYDFAFVSGNRLIPFGDDPNRADVTDVLAAPRSARRDRIADRWPSG